MKLSLFSTVRDMTTVPVSAIIIPDNSIIYNTPYLAKIKRSISFTLFEIFTSFRFFTDTRSKFFFLGIDIFICFQYNIYCSSEQHVRLAQLDRAFGYGPKGREFESSNARRIRHSFLCLIFLLSSVNSFLFKLFALAIRHASARFFGQ